MANKPEKEKKEKKNFFKNFRAELKKVIWPTPKQVINSTIAVVTVVLITALIVFVLDLAFEGLNTFGINKLKAVVTDNKNNELVENSVENAEENVTETDENIVEDTNVDTTDDNAAVVDTDNSVEE